jgi:hypothetical protein
MAALPQKTELDKIAYMMQFSQELSERTQIYRQYLEWNSKRKPRKKIKEKQKNMKTTRFPTFAPCAIFYGGSARKNVIELTDLCFLDIDKIEKQHGLRKP